MSADIFDFDAERGKRDQPDDEFVMTNDDEFTLYLFSADYEVDGAAHSVELWAFDLADAERQVEAMRASLNLVGQLMARV